MLQRLCIGDKVEYITTTNTFWKTGAIHIIEKCEYNGGGEIGYATNKGEWFTSKDFRLIKKANKKAFRILDRSMDER